MDYRFLFPYEKVKPGSKIIIYGAGTLGQDYLKQMIITGYCRVIAMADRNHGNYPGMIVPVIAPEEICRFEYDYIVLAIRVEIAKNEIARILREQGVADDKIVCIYERNNTDITVFSKEDSYKNYKTSYKDSEESMAILLSGGLGDNIIQKRFVTELIKFAPEIAIDIYSIRNTDYLRYLYSDIANIRNVIEDLGSRYDGECHNYTFSLVMEACRYVRVDECREKTAYSDLSQRLKKVMNESDKEKITLSTPTAVPNSIRLFQGLNAYNCFNYNGAFDIQDKKVGIPITDNGEHFYNGLGLKQKQFYTVNFGTGECADPSKVAKMWYQDRFEEVISLMKDRYPDIQVIQLGASNAIQLKGIDKYVLGESMDRVASLLKRTLFHLDIEGGTVHMATQLGIKCIVLFGPSPEEFYGYEENENIHSGRCQGCLGLLPDVNKCARDMERPECMDLITPEMVLERIEKVLNN